MRAAPGDTTLWLHGTEALSLATYGRWPSRAWPVDGFSGEFPTYYNYASDYLLNAWAAWLDLPPAFAQAAIYGPLLAAALVFLNYLCLAYVLGHRGKALLAAVIISFGTDLPFPDAVYASFGEANVPGMKARMHVPFVAMPLATSQCLGWLLFLPVLTSVFAMCTRRTFGWALASGAGLGLLFQTHTLTFLNVTTCALVFVYAHSLSEPSARVGPSFPWAHRLRIGIVAAASLALVLAAIDREEGFSPGLFAILWFTLLVASIKSRRELLLATAMVAAALVASAHYLLHLFAELDYLGTLGSPRAGGMMRFPSVVLYFMPLWVAALATLGLMPRWHEPRRIWAYAMLFVTLSLSLGHYWGYWNHPYRMSINLIFPLAILFAEFAFADTIAPWKRGAFLVPVLLLASVALTRNVWSLQEKGAPPRVLGSVARYYAVKAASPEEMTFLKILASHLSGGGRVLLPPEHRFPRGTTRNALILSHSRIPALLPDPRFIAWKDLYGRRLGLFCVLFPSFPHADTIMHARHCAAHPSDSIDRAGSIIAVDPSVRSDVLALYDIRYVAHWTDHVDLPFGRWASDRGMETIYAGPGKGLYRVPPVKAPRVEFRKATHGPEGQFRFAVSVPRPGCYAFVLSGPELAKSLASMTINGAPVTPSSIGAEGIHFTMEIEAGISQVAMFFPADRRMAQVAPTPLVFAMGVPVDLLDTFVRLDRTVQPVACSVPVRS